MTVRLAMTGHLVIADHVAAVIAARAMIGPIAVNDLKPLRTMIAPAFAEMAAADATDSVVVQAEVGENIEVAEQAAPGHRQKSRSIARRPLSRQWKARFPAGLIRPGMVVFFGKR